MARSQEINVKASHSARVAYLVAAIAMASTATACGESEESFDESAGAASTGRPNPIPSATVASTSVYRTMASDINCRERPGTASRVVRTFDKDILLEADRSRTVASAQGWQWVEVVERDGFDTKSCFVAADKTLIAPVRMPISCRVQSVNGKSEVEVTRVELEATAVPGRYEFMETGEGQRISSGTLTIAEFGKRATGVYRADVRVKTRSPGGYLSAATVLDARDKTLTFYDSDPIGRGRPVVTYTCKALTFDFVDGEVNGNPVIPQ
jgi:hypothetical protein